MSETTAVYVKAMPSALVGALDDRAAREGVSRQALLIRAAEQFLGSAGTGIEQDLVSTHAAYRRHRARLRAVLAEVALTEAEASLICDALNGHAMTYDLDGCLPGAVGIYAEVEDAAMWDKWEVDRSTLRAKLRALTPIQAAAVADAAELFWLAADVRDSGAVLRAVGMVVDR